MQPTKKSVIYPAVRFTPDVDEKGVQIIDPRTKEWKSGTLHVELQEATTNGASTFVSGFSEAMSFTKYKAIREDIDHLSVSELKQYFPQLRTEADLAKEKAAKTVEKKATTEVKTEADAKAKTEEK